MSYTRAERGVAWVDTPCNARGSAGQLGEGGKARALPLEPHQEAMPHLRSAARPKAPPRGGAARLRRGRLLRPFIWEPSDTNRSIWVVSGIDRVVPLAMECVPQWLRSRFRCCAGTVRPGPRGRRLPRSYSCLARASPCQMMRWPRAISLPDHRAADLVAQRGHLIGEVAQAVACPAQWRAGTRRSGRVYAYRARILSRGVSRLGVPG